MDDIRDREPGDVNPGNVAGELVIMRRRLDDLTDAIGNLASAVKAQQLPPDEIRSARRNHYGEAVCALRGLVAAWKGDTEDPAYRASVRYLQGACRSCGEPATKNSLCGPCWRAFEARPKEPTAA